jgi:hypothetical protein
MRPVGQLLLARANDSRGVGEYLTKEPLLAHGALSPSGWQVFELKVLGQGAEQEDPLRVLAGTLRADPYLSLKLYEGSKGGKGEKKAKGKGLEAAFQSTVSHFVQKCSGGVPSLDELKTDLGEEEFEDEFDEVDEQKAGQETGSKMAIFGKLLHVKENNEATDLVTTSKGAKKQEEETVAGVLMLFSALSRKDAIRFSTEDSSEGKLYKSTVVFT